MELKFYVCRHCGNVITYEHASGVKVVCCGDEMKELVPNTVEAATEKHFPVITQEGRHVTVKIGSIEHPMTEEHHIEWILLQTDEGIQKKWLEPGEKPEACFELSEGETVEAAYEYCNLHGLWKTQG